MAESVLSAAIGRTPTAVALRGESYRLLGLRVGEVCVDVPCGTGDAVAELAATGVQMVGVDRDAAVVARARERTPGAEFHVASADALPLEDAAVDGYRAAGLFHLLDDPLPTLAEARRVLRPGGRVVLADHDHGFLLADSDDQDLTDVVLLGLESRSVAPRAARMLRNQLLDLGFEKVQVVVHSQVLTGADVVPGWLERAADAAVDRALITRADADDWLTDQHDRIRRDRFLAIVPTLLVTATR